MSEDQKASYVNTVVDPTRFSNYGIKVPEGKKKIRQALPIVKNIEIQEEPEILNVDDTNEDNDLTSEELTVDASSSTSPSPSSPSPRPLTSPSSMSETDKKKYLNTVMNPNRFKNYNETITSTLSSRPLSERLEEKARLDELNRQSSLKLLKDSNMKSERKRKESINSMQVSKIVTRAKYKIQAEESKGVKERLRREAERKMEEYWERKVREEGGGEEGIKQQQQQQQARETEEERIMRVEEEEKRREEEEFKRMVEAREREILLERQRIEESARLAELERQRIEESTRLAELEREKEEERAQRYAEMQRIESERIKAEESRIFQENAEKERVRLEKEEAMIKLKQEQERKALQLQAVEQQKKEAAMEKIRLAEEESRMIREQIEKSKPLRQKVDLTGVANKVEKKEEEKKEEPKTNRKVITEEEKMKAKKFGIRIDDL
ncbi:hypothetical protein TrST_g4658 [Triparma strigata]|uniref:Uncharacterized protein n=1 Tax=Triparma strigata TaxID=1606541 RepID=A0A9W7DT42_9STRA|nr:hypothetical protein TrST_g4658 [Triparma strigata]